MSVSVAQLSKFQFSDNGAPIVGGLLFTYAAGTTTKLTTYQDSFGAVPNTNPIVLDADGQCNLYLTDGLGYKFVLSPPGDSDPPTDPYWTVDNILSAAGAAGGVSASIVPEGPFESGTDFTPGTTTTLTLSQAYGRPVNVTVHFDGIYQAYDQYSLSGDQIIFNSPIPVGTNTVYIVGGLVIGSGYITSPQLASQVSPTGASLVGFLQAGTGAAGRTLQSKDSDIIDIRDWGAQCDGTTNDSAAVQACIDANKGRRIVHSHGVCLAGGLLLSGSIYNGTEIVCTGGTFLLTPDAGASNFDGGWAGVIVKDCSYVYLDLEWDGNQSAMTQTREQIYCVALAAATDLTMPRLKVKNIQGDGICIGQSLYLSNTTPSARINIGTVSGYNDTDLGRNLVTIISVLGCNIDVVDSVNIGGTINSVRQPGGLDIEPDYGYETCDDIVIGQINVTTAGTSGVAVLGQAVTNDATGDWNTSRVKIGMFNVVFTANQPSNVNFNRGFDVVAKGSVAYSVALGTGNVGCNVDYQNRFKLDITAYNTTNALVVGAVGNVVDFDINLQADYFTVAGLSTCSLTRGRFTGKARSATTTAYAIQCTNQGRSGIVQTNVAYEVDAPYDGGAVGGFYNVPGSPVTYSLSYLRNCNFSNYPTAGAANNSTIILRDVFGITNSQYSPTSGTWEASTFVRANSLASFSSGTKVLLGWARQNTGSNNVLGTDWVDVIATTS